MELLVVVTVFAVCAAICVKILAVSHLMTTNAVDTRNALLVAESAAESHKAFGGDTARLAEILNGYANGADTVRVFYCSDWQPGSIENADFILELITHSADNTAVIFADITVSRVVTGDELISLTAAVRRAQQ